MIEKITLDELPEEQKDIAQVTGLEAYLKLVENFGGSTIYIFKEDSLTFPIRNKEIKEAFRGSNFRSLAVKYGLSEQTIRNIIKL